KKTIGASVPISTSTTGGLRVSDGNSPADVRITTGGSLVVETVAFRTITDGVAFARNDGEDGTKAHPPAPSSAGSAMPEPSSATWTAALVAAERTAAACAKGEARNAARDRADD